MKNIPIVILNKDRLNPLKMLVNSLTQRGYNNITIIDNQTTYQPTLDWYEQCGVTVFKNTIDQTLYDTGTFYRLAFELTHPIFSEIVKDFYVFTDSDVVPIDEAPDDFINSMIEVCKQFNVGKVGLGLKIDDLPNTDFSKHVISIESPFWQNKISHSTYELYHASIDTTFAVYAPNTKPLWQNEVIRMAGNFMSKHIPWYYDIDNMPADETYYLENLHDGRGPTYSPKVKQMIQSKKVNNEQ